MAENSLPDLKKYFSTPDKPVSTIEMSDFWKSLLNVEKEYYKTADLT